MRQAVLRRGRLERGATMTVRGQSAIADWVFLLAFSVVALICLHPALAAGFVLIDDHEILAFTDGARLSSALGEPAGLAQRVLVEDPRAGRTRPFYWVTRQIEIAFLDATPLLWHALVIGMGIASAMLLFAGLRMMGMDRISAWLASAWLLVVPGASSAWIRLGPQESLGTLLLCAAGYAAIRGSQPGAHVGWDWLFALSLSAAVMTKESFVLAARR